MLYPNEWENRYRNEVTDYIIELKIMKERGKEHRNNVVLFPTQEVSKKTWEKPRPW
jgi:hypothetical protein